MAKKIKGTIVVEFEMTGAEFQSAASDVASKMKSNLQSRLDYEWQTSHCKPLMKTFEWKEVKKTSKK